MHCSQQSGAPDCLAKSCGDLRRSVTTRICRGLPSLLGPLNSDRIGWMGSGGLVELPTELPVRSIQILEYLNMIEKMKESYSTELNLNLGRLACPARHPSNTGATQKCQSKTRKIPSTPRPYILRFTYYKLGKEQLLVCCPMVVELPLRLP